MMAYSDLLYNQCISNMRKFSIFTFPAGQIKMFEIRFASTGVICGNLFPLLCKKKKLIRTDAPLFPGKIHHPRSH